MIRSIVIDECRRLVALAIELGATKQSFAQRYAVPGARQQGPHSEVQRGPAMTLKSYPRRRTCRHFNRPRQVLIEAGHTPHWTARAPADPLRLMLRRVLDGCNDTTPHLRFGGCNEPR